MGLGNINLKNFTNKALILAALITLLTAFFTFSSGKNLPNRNPESEFNSPMLELQLSSSKEEVLGVLGSSLSKNEIKFRKALNIQNFYDSFFVFCYPVYLALVFIFFYKSNRNTPYRELIIGLGLSLCFFMLVSDLYENSRIYRLTSAFSQDGIYKSTLNGLMVSSRIKFAAIFLSCVVIAGNYIIYTLHNKNVAPKLLLRFFAAFYMLSGLAGYFSLVIKKANFFVENCLVYVAICWLITFIHVASLTVFKKKKPPARIFRI